MTTKPKKVSASNALAALGRFKIADQPAAVAPQPKQIPVAQEKKNRPAAALAALATNVAKAPLLTERHPVTLLTVRTSETDRKRIQEMLVFIASRNRKPQMSSLIRAVIKSINPDEDFLRQYDLALESPADARFTISSDPDTSRHLTTVLQSVTASGRKYYESNIVRAGLFRVTLNTDFLNLFDQTSTLKRKPRR